ncbi:MAG: hypothetical protein AAF357_06930 [Verrucomicrobiota bacterium]
MFRQIGKKAPSPPSEVFPILRMMEEVNSVQEIRKAIDELDGEEWRAWIAS